MFRYLFLVLLALSGAFTAAPVTAMAGVGAEALDFKVILGGEQHPLRDGAPNLLYQPVSPTASLKDRLACWQALRVQSLDDASWAAVGDGWMKATEQGHYYRNAGAKEALALYHQGQTARTKGLVWLIAAPELGGLTGLVIGAGIGALQPARASVRNGQTYTQSDQQAENTAIGEVLGLLGGGVLGLGLGALMLHHEQNQARDLRAQAGESFNRKLLQDLRLRVEPVSGGGAVKVQGKF